MSSLIRLNKINRLGGVAIAAILGATIAFVAVQLTRPAARPSGAAIIQGPPGPTLADPLAAPAQQTTMAAAVTGLGVSVPLPNTSAVQPSDAHAVWEGSWSGGTSTTMAVAYPSQGLIIYYHRPALQVTNQAQTYQQTAAQIPSGRVVDLNGTTPALVIAQNSDMTGENFGVVAFVVNGTEVQVRGHTDDATLEAIAQSILTQWPSTTSSTPSASTNAPRG